MNNTLLDQQHMNEHHSAILEYIFNHHRDTILGVVALVTGWIGVKHPEVLSAGFLSNVDKQDLNDIHLILTDVTLGISVITGLIFIYRFYRTQKEAYLRRKAEKKADKPNA